MKVLKAITKILLTISVIVVLVLAAVKMPNRQCSEVNVKLHYSGEVPTVSESEILSLINQAGIETVGLKLKEVDMEGINHTLSTHPYIKSINEVYFAGTQLLIDVTLKNVLLHVYPKSGDQYFIDDEGKLLPFSSRVKDNIMVVNGNIGTVYKPNSNIKTQKSNINAVFNIAKLIEENEFYTAQFRQLYVNDKNEIEIVPTVGKHVILFGDDKNAEEKLFNLKETYTNGLAYMGMDQYSLLDVRFKNRVIARKKINS
ncbi:MAG: hypothetical protein RR356_01860 [Bacteroidales bacterium]